MYCAHLAGILCMVYRNDILFLTILIFSCYSIFMWSIFVNVDQDSFLISLFIALSSVVSMECSKGRWHTFFDILAHHPLPMPGFAADLASALGLNLPGLGLTVTPGGRPACVLSTHQGIYLEVCRGHLWRDPGESGFSVGGVLSRLGLCFGTSAGASLCSAWWRHPLGGATEPLPTLTVASETVAAQFSLETCVEAQSQGAWEGQATLPRQWDIGSSSPGATRTLKLTFHTTLKISYILIKKKFFLNHVLPRLIFSHPTSRLGGSFWSEACLLGYLSLFFYGMWNIEPTCAKLAHLSNFARPKKWGQEDVTSWITPNALRRSCFTGGQCCTTPTHPPTHTHTQRPGSLRWV